MMKRTKKLIAIMAVFMLVLAMMPATAFAASNPYKDVTKAKVGKSAYNAIVYVKAHNGYKGVVSGKKFYPKKKITRKEFIKILVNFYGEENVPTESGDKSKKVATAKWACAKMVDVADAIGIEITWDDSNKKLSRALASQYLKVFVDFDSAFKPRE